MKDINKRKIVTKSEIEAARTPNGGWTRAQLETWGVSWPPKKGWKKELEKGETEMDNYLGEIEIDIDQSEFCMFSPQDWAIHWICEYGFFDGDHHKQWVVDQIFRILKKTPVIVKLARWGKSESDVVYSETRFVLGEPSVEYLNWRKDNQDWDEGIAP